MARANAERLSRFGAGEWWALGSALTYAFANVMTRLVSVTGDPLAGSIIRTLPITIIGCGLMVWRHRETMRRLLPGRQQFFGWRAVGLLALYALVISPLASFAIYLAFRYGGVLVAAPVLALHPLWGALIAVPFLGEAFNKRIGGGIVIAVLGIALLTYGQHIGAPVSPQWPLGLLFAMVTAVCFAVGANLNRFLIPHGVDVFSLLGLTNVGALVVMGVGLWASGRFEALAAFSAGEVWRLFLAGGLSGLGSILLFTAFAFTTVASATTLKSLDTGLASLIAVFALTEAVNWPIALGLVLILGGAWIVQMGKVLRPPTVTV
jgi:drug/metabolite transporter (DMT)-like permease